MYSSRLTKSNYIAVNSKYDLHLGKNTSFLSIYFLNVCYQLIRQV